MALAYTGRSYYNAIPQGSTCSFNHTQATGADGHLIVAVASPALSVSSVTYGGVSMTLADTQRNNYYSTYWSFWELDAPATGSNQVVVTFSGGQWNSTSVNAFSFTGCSGAGTPSYYNTPVTNKNTTSLIVSENAFFIATGMGSGVNNEGLEVPNNTSITKLYTHGVNNYVWGGVKTTGLSAGAMTWATTNVNNNSIMYGLEIEEAPSVVIPTVRTDDATNITSTGAVLNGAVTDVGGETPSDYGFWIDTSVVPQNGTKLTPASGVISDFAYTLSTLTPNTTYYFQAYAENSAGFGYGLIKSFSTDPAPTTRRRVIIM